jgi:hypothetical protein
MRFFQNLKQNQIGTELGYFQMHISRLLRRALRQMRDRLVWARTAVGAGGRGKGAGPRPPVACRSGAVASLAARPTARIRMARSHPTRRPGSAGSPPHHVGHRPSRALRCR